MVKEKVFADVQFIGGPLDGKTQTVDVTDVKDEIMIYSKPSFFNSLDCHCIYKLDGNVATFSHDIKE